MTDIQKTIDTITKKLTAAGIRNQPYTRGPIGKDTFYIDIVQDTIRIWPGTANITVRTSKKHKQAVLVVTEERRTIKHSLTIGPFANNSWAMQEFDPKTKELTTHLENTFRSQFPTNLPDVDNIKWKISDFQAHDSEKDHWGTVVRSFSATVTATIPKTKLTFLIGQDESHPFISLLPKEAKSVADAHQILRPKGLSKKALRQGEWFFDPVSDNIAQALDDLIAKKPFLLDEPEALTNPNDAWEDGTHFAHVMVYRKKLYAIGFVTDRDNTRWQLDRPRHHKPLWLPDWHEVKHNTELVPPDRMAGNAWD